MLYARIKIGVVTHPDRHHHLHIFYRNKDLSPFLRKIAQFRIVRSENSDETPAYSAPDRYPQSDKWIQRIAVKNPRVDSHTIQKPRLCQGVKIHNCVADAGPCTRILPRHLENPKWNILNRKITIRCNLNP